MSCLKTTGVVKWCCRLLRKAVEYPWRCSELIWTRSWAALQLTLLWEWGQIRWSPELCWAIDDLTSLFCNYSINQIWWELLWAQTWTSWSLESLPTLIIVWFYVVTFPAHFWIQIKSSNCRHSLHLFSCTQLGISVLSLREHQLELFQFGFPLGEEHSIRSLNKSPLSDYGFLFKKYKAKTHTPTWMQTSEQQSKHSSTLPDDRMLLTLFLIKGIIIQLPSTAPYKF